MPSTRYTKPFWLERAPSPRQKWDRLRGHVTCEVAVIGGGLAGCATAYTFAQAGISTALLEADLVGVRTTAHGPGLCDPGAASSFFDLRERHGLRAARHMWQASRRACLDTQALIGRLRMGCDVTPVSVNDIAVDAHQGVALEREYRALAEAGFDAIWLTGARVRPATGVQGVAALKRADAFVADPYALTVGLAHHAARRRAQVFERSRVLAIRASANGVDVRTDAGSVSAGTVVVATNHPEPGMKALRRHFAATATTAAVLPGLPRGLRKGIGGGEPRVVRTCAHPRQIWRVDTNGTLFLWQSDQAAPAPTPTALGAAAVQRTGQLMYEFSLLHPEVSGLQPSLGWTLTSYRSLDGVLIAGPHRGFPRHLFAVGLGVEGLQAALLAARVNLRHYRGMPERGDEYFGFVR